MSEKSLNISDLVVAYDGVPALKGISLQVGTAEVTALIGANGAGKSTLLRTISGLLRPKSGRIEFNNIRLERKRPREILQIGISQVPEGRKIFPQMTVFENLKMGAFILKDKNDVRTNLEVVFDIFPILLEREKQKAGTLSGGQQQMLSIGRALMSNPSFIMMDEPTIGLSPLVSKVLLDAILRMIKLSKTVFLVEQNVKIALEMSSVCYVLETGKIILREKSEELITDKDMLKKYLGVDSV